MLKPSRRDKKRYIVVKVFGERNYTFQEVMSSIMKYAYEYGGYSFIAKSNLNLVRDLFLEDKNIAVISVMPRYVEEVRFVVMSIKEVAKSAVSMHVLGVSGTIKSAKKKYIQMEP